MTDTGKKPKILCIDDKEDNLKIRTTMLELFGCETLSAYDYDGTMEVLQQAEVDLLLIDYHLANGRTGEEIAKDVRVMRPEIRLIMLTGDTKVPQGAQDFFDAVLMKGTSDPKTLLATIQELLPEKDLRTPRPNLVDRPNHTRAS